MEPIQFVYWLRGFIELAKSESGQYPMLDRRQVELIDKHIDLMLKPVVRTPSKEEVAAFQKPLRDTPAGPARVYPSDGTDVLIHKSPDPLHVPLCQTIPWAGSC